MNNSQEVRFHALEASIKFHNEKSSITQLLITASQFEKFILTGHMGDEDVFSITNDPVEFVKTCKVSNPSRGSITFTPQDFQKKMLSQIKDNKKVSILSARQMGTTTTLTLYCLWFALRHPNTTIVLMSNKLAMAHSMLDIIISNAKNVMGHQVSSTTNHLQFDNGSKIMARNAHPTNIGDDIDLIWIDNATFVSHVLAQDIKTKLNALGRGRVILSSTAGDTKGLFFDCYQSGLNEKDGWLSFKFPWQLYSDRDEQWRKSRIDMLGEQQFQRDYECCFISS